MIEKALTLEEARVIEAYPSTPPTEPSLVTRSTPLEDLNLNWRESELPERIRTRHVHRLHPYLGKYIPQLVEIFLRKYFSPGDTVADPFGGSGTTLVQANELGINSVGYDISAFNVLLMRVKTAKRDLAAVKRDAHDALARTVSLLGDATALPGIYDNLEIELVDSAYLDDWFAPSALRHLLAYRSIVNSGAYENADLLKVILSRSARSARLTTHFDLDFPKKPVSEPYHCYKHSRICQPTQDALKFLDRYTIDAVKRVIEFQSIRTDAAVDVVHGDSRTVQIPTIDGLITSPPYVGLIDYHEQHTYAYHLLGLKDRRPEEIGAAAQGTSQAARKRYQEDIASVFSNFLAKMPVGGPLIVVAGDKQNLYPGIAEILNVHVEAVVQRHVNRRTGRRGNAFFESVFVWRKR